MTTRPSRRRFAARLDSGVGHHEEGGGVYWLIRRVGEMPQLMTWLVVLGLLTPVIAVGSAIQDAGELNAEALHFSVLRLVVVAPTFAAAILVLARVGWSRALYALGILAAHWLPYWLPAGVEVPPHGVAVVLFPVILAAGIATYLYASKGVVGYFARGESGGVPA